MINQKVRDYLIKVAKEKRWTYYSEVNDVCSLGFNLNLYKDNNALSDLLGEISKYEVNNKRHMLSVIVVHYDDTFGATHQCGDGFFRWAEELGIKDKNKPDFQFFREELKKVFDYWEKN